MAEAHRRFQKMIQERDSELEIKDEQIRIKDAEIRLLNKELGIWKAENAILTGQITTMEKVKSEQVHAKQENETTEETPNVIKNMKEELERLKEEKTDIEKTHNNTVEDMKNELKKLKEEKENTEQRNTITIQKMNYEITEMKKEKLAIQETHNNMVQSLRNELSELKSKVNPEEEINQTENTGVIQNYKTDRMMKQYHRVHQMRKTQMNQRRNRIDLLKQYKLERSPVLHTEENNVLDVEAKTI